MKDSNSDDKQSKRSIQVCFLWNTNDIPKSKSAIEKNVEIFGTPVKYPIIGYLESVDTDGVFALVPTVSGLKRAFYIHHKII